MTKAPARPAVVRKPPMSEAKLQTNVIDAAHKFGWTVVHFRAARVIKNGAESWRTPVQGDGKGFPDLVMVHRVRGVGLAVELKSARGPVTDEQYDWLDLFARSGWWTRIWRPVDWHNGAIE